MIKKLKRINDLLNPNEQILKEFSPDFIKIFLTNKISGLSIFILVAIVLGIFALELPPVLLIIPILLLSIGAVPAFMKCHFTKYYLTNQKIIIETGIIGRDYDIVKLDRVFDVNIDVTVLDTIFSTGSLKLSTSNDSEPVIIRDIRNPKQILRCISF